MQEGPAVFSISIAFALFGQQPSNHNQFKCIMASRKLYDISKGQTVTSELARDPSQCPQKVFHRLFEGHHLSHKLDDVDDLEADKISQWEQLGEVEKARACGNFGSTETSDLFLKVSRCSWSITYRHSNSFIVRFTIKPCALWKRTPSLGSSPRLYRAAPEYCP